MERDSVIKKILFRLAVALAVVALIVDFASRTTMLECPLDGADPGAIRSLEIIVEDAVPTSTSCISLTVNIENDPAFYADLLAIFETITVRPRLFKPDRVYFQRGEAYRFTFDIDGLIYQFDTRNKHNMTVYARHNERVIPRKPYRIFKGKNLPAIYDLLVRYGYIPPDQEADPT